MSNSELERLFARHIFATSRHHEDGFALPGAELHYPPDVELEPVHLDLALEVDIEAKTLNGVVRHTVLARCAGPQQIRLNAVDFRDVQVADPDDNPLSWQYDGEEIVVDWDAPFDAHEKRHLEVTYCVVNPVAGLYFRSPTSEYPDAPRYAASDNETERARHWLPTIDLPNVRPTLEFKITHPSDLTALANGYLLSRKETDDGKTVSRWRLDQRCPSYLTCFVVAELVECQDGEFDGKPIAYYTTAPHTPEDLKRSFGRTHDMLSWMTELLDHPFPYPKYYQFALPGFGGAMENISLVSWDSVFVLDEALSREWGWLVDQINVHEMAHSYFGDLVVCRDYANAWLKESWATYIESCWLQHARGEDEYRYDIFVSSRLYFEEADNNYQRAIMTRKFSHSWDMYDLHLYPGGAIRLDMLRKHLGDEAFWQGVRNYVAHHAHKVVETDDFRHELEAVSGKSLGRFFDQWIRSPGYPHLEVSFEFDKKAGEGTFSLEQKQADDDHPPFSFDLELGWVDGEGQLHLREVEVGKAKERFVFPMTDDPKQVRVDPNSKAVFKLDFNSGTPRLKSQLTDAKDVVGRILASRELLKSGVGGNVQAVLEACANESFWGVRLEMYRHLGDCGVQAAADALAVRIRDEQDPMTLATLMQVAGSYRDAGIRHALEARLDAGDLPYRATAAALASLGKQREHAPLARLIEAARTDSYHGLVQVGALQGLAESRSRDALAPLIELTAPGAIRTDRARAAAALALGDLARFLEREERERAIDCLETLLRDPMERVQKGAANALGGLDEGRAASALERFKAPLAAQDRVGIERKLLRMRTRMRGKGSGYEKEVESLRETVRKLEDRLCKLEAKAEPDNASS